MDISDNKFSDIVDLLKSWIPWRSEPETVSRDFWMSDESCRVCYDCDSQFTLLNRKHHCRICGRIFCARCTANSVPVQSSDPRTAREEQEKIRACNYCFKQWKQGISSVGNGAQDPCLDLSSSQSEASAASSKSSGTANSSDFALSSVPYSVGPYQLAQLNSGPSSHQAPEMERNSDKKEQMALGRSNDLAAEEEYYPPNSYAFSFNRSDDDEGECNNVFVSYKEIKDLSQFNDYYQQVEFDDMRNVDGGHKSHLDGEAFDSKSLSSSPLDHSFGSQGLEGLTRPRDKHELEVDDECEPTSSMYPGEDDDTDPVDFENNGLLWLPPEPEDEEDEKETGLFDEDDDDGDATGGWGCLRASNSFGSGEFRSRYRSSEEHKQVMKNVVDGHFRALVAQLLQVQNISFSNDENNWLEIITSLSWEAATLLKPDMSKGGGMDPGGYVKVKCIASGRPSDSMVVRGVVCKKNVAHRRMTSKIEKPRLLILEGALEYQRVTNHLSSVATLLQQEMDHLRMAVAKIDAHQPDVLLVENSVSRFAQEYLLAKDISVVLNVKRTLLDRIARCTGAQVVPSVDHLSSPKLGYCELFHVERFSEDLGSAGQNGKKMTKTLMFFEGCPKPLGFTILLRGANGDVLKKVKHVVQLGVFAAYHLALETCFLADEGATLPELPLNSPITVTLPGKASSVERSISTVPGFTFPADEKPKNQQTDSEPQRSNSVPDAHLVSMVSTSSVEKAEKVLADSPLPDSMKPSASHINSSELLSAIVPDHTFENKNGMCSQDCSLPKDSAVDNGLASDGILSNNSPNDANKIVANQLTSLEVSSAQKDSKSNSFAELGNLKEEFPPSPSDQQSILVSLSSRCVWNGTVCERSHLFRIKYYGSFDKPLGRFLQDHLFDESYSCQSCEMPSEAHVHCYTHQQGTLTISVKKLSETLLPGEKDGKIWMWHRCLKCPRVNCFPPANRRIVMSDAAWGLSFGKFLELSFSNHAAASRVASCGHSLHRDCLRFYGFGKMVACFRYASINVLSVYLPPSKVDFNFENQEWIRKETEEVIKRAELLFSEVLSALGQIAEERSASGATYGFGKLSEFKRQIARLEEMFKQEKAEFEESVRKTLKREVKNGLPAFDILEINRLRRQLLFQSYIWDHHLVSTASLDGSGIQDSSSRLNSAYDETASINADHLMEMDLAYSSGKGFSSDDSRPVDVKLLKVLDQQEFGGEENQPDGFDNEVDITEGFNLGKEGPANISDANLTCNQPDKWDSGGNIRKNPSEGQFPIMKSLSDTLDAAWTGENHPGSGNNDYSPLSDSGMVDSSNTLAGPDGFDMEDRLVDQNEPKVRYSLAPAFSSKGSDNIDDSVSWLRMPFLNFYRSLNKNFLANSEKFNTVGEYNPVYLSSFRESELQNEAGRFLPEGVNNIIIPVYDDEPTSIISYALTTQDYNEQLTADGERISSPDLSSSLSSSDVVNSMSFHSLDEVFSGSYKTFGSTDESLSSKSGSRSSSILDPLSYTKALHARVAFDSKVGKVKYSVTSYYAKRFEALRRICCTSELDYIRSLSRCKKWGAQGGKSNVFFAKTLDERFIIKQVTKTELESFIKFAPSYFKYLSESISLKSPTSLAKILGIYQVTSKHLKGGKEWKMDVLVMENLLFARNMTRVYDLKGSSRSRYNPDINGKNKVLLDQNLIEAMPTSPIFVGNKAKRLLERAVWNDTAFLASIDVMDYSLLVGVDEEKHELVIGIIDFMRQYTWDKHLETWVKTSGILGGPKNASPTVISPKQYKKRFRKAMSTYFLMVPDQWSPLSIIPSRSQSDLAEENAQVSTPVE